MCYDDAGCIWVACKAGLFKFDSDGKRTRTLMFSRKNDFPKKIAPYCSVICVQGKIIYAFCDDKSALSEFRILDLAGNELHEQFIDGKIQSLVGSSATGDLFMTKQPTAEESTIFRTNIDCPIGWEEVVTSDEFAFQSICLLDDDTLIAATASTPVNMYSRQALKRISISKAAVVASFSCAGKNDGEVYFPRAIQRLSENSVLVLDKTGRFQRFDVDTGKMTGILAHIDAYIGNGFVIREDQAVIVCSGIVLDEKQETVCDDWLEKINLDGSRWTPPAPAN